jgi:hypothetical protein
VEERKLINRRDRGRSIDLHQISQIRKKATPRWPSLQQGPGMSAEEKIALDLALVLLIIVLVWARWQR